MTPQQILFIVFGVITVGAALALVTRKNVFHAALFMILSFFGVAGIYVLLEAPFLAGVQLFIYVGGISILMIMAIMVTRDMMKPEIVGHTRQWLAAAAVSVALCAVLIGVILGHDGWAAAVSSSGAVPQDSIAILGNTLVDAQGLALPFEVASVLLLVALIGAATIVRER